VELKDIGFHNVHEGLHLAEDKRSVGLLGLCCEESSVFLCANNDFAVLQDFNKTDQFGAVLEAWLHGG
jgi:hypothetical protein